MSIRKQIALHPASKEHLNQPLGDAVHHLMYCAKMCLSCADACMAERQEMTQCIRLCLDCSDICEVTARLGLRRTGNDQPILLGAGFLIGAVFLWGGVVAVTVNYVLAARREPPG